MQIILVMLRLPPALTVFLMQTLPDKKETIYLHKFPCCQGQDGMHFSFSPHILIACNTAFFGSLQ